MFFLPDFQGLWRKLGEQDTTSGMVAVLEKYEKRFAREAKAYLVLAIFAFAGVAFQIAILCYAFCVCGGFL